MFSGLGTNRNIATMAALLAESGPQVTNGVSYKFYTIEKKDYAAGLNLVFIFLFKNMNPSGF